VGQLPVDPPAGSRGSRIRTLDDVTARHSDGIRDALKLWIAKNEDTKLRRRRETSVADTEDIPSPVTVFRIPQRARGDAKVTAPSLSPCVKC
jgi:hypothetical protein